VNVREVPGNNVDDDNNGFVDDLVGWNFLDDNGQVFVSAQTDFHGTHVAGTIGAVGNNTQGTTGVAWRVKLMSLKFLGVGPGTTSNAIKTIRYAVEQKRRGVNLRAINASWGGAGDSQSLYDAIREAGEAGITFVCSAGNGGSDYRGDNTDEFPDYPGSWSSEISSIISVAAIDRSDELAGFSNYGHMTITVAAPGVQILSTYPGSLYVPISGTSMSTPHVTGIVALLTTYDPSLTPAQVRARIIRTAEPVLSLASKVVSSGRANAFNALTDRVPPPGSLGISAVRTDKKFVYVDGLNFVSGSTVGEVNGVRLKKTRYDDSYAVGNGTLTRLRIKLGKSGVRDTFPLGVPVTVTVFDPNTGERSPGFTYTRY
jgi:subtilisin family serine protease